MLHLSASNDLFERAAPLRHVNCANLHFCSECVAGWLAADQRSRRGNYFIWPCVRRKLLDKSGRSPARTAFSAPTNSAHRKIHKIEDKFRPLFHAAAEKRRMRKSDAYFNNNESWTLPLSHHTGRISVRRREKQKINSGKFCVRLRRPENYFEAVADT